MSAKPVVYFIDDSATMREVIKIAFRKENIHVITCADAASALAQFSGVAPDAVGLRTGPPVFARGGSASGALGLLHGAGVHRARSPIAPLDQYG